MESVIEKLSFLSKLNCLNENFKISEIDNNLVKMIKISVKCNAFDVNEDKQRQCYKQLKCFWPKCRYSFKNKCALNYHISRHLNGRQFVCDDCKKSFNSCSHLTNHKDLVHSNVRQFICYKSDCQKSYKCKSLLKRHLKTHSTEKSLKCDECDKRFRYKDLLLRHKLIHSKQMPFRCDAIECDKRFRQKKSS